MSEAKAQHSAQKTKKIKKVPEQQATNQPLSSNTDKKNQKKDDRFAKASYDPKFMTPSSKVTKVKIDKRFSKMMSDPSFKNTSSIDRYGRRVNPNETNNELKQYYYM
jgi:hypothetical protein